MHLVLMIQTLALLTVANVTPLFAKKLFGNALAVPLDGGAVFMDGRPLLGPAKTIRGIVMAVGVTSMCAPLVALNWQLGAVAGIAAMTGDVLSSFVKRRVGFAPSTMAVGLDQIPESLLPALVLRVFLPLTLSDLAIVTAIFFAGEVFFAWVFFKLRLRDRPY